MVRMLDKMGGDVHKHRRHVARALRFLETFRGPDGLIHEDVFGGNWEDTLMFQGPFRTRTFLLILHGIRQTHSHGCEPKRTPGGWMQSAYP